MVVADLPLKRFRSLQPHDGLARIEARVADRAADVEFAVARVSAILKGVVAVLRVQFAPHNRVTALEPCPARLAELWDEGCLTQRDADEADAERLADFRRARVACLHVRRHRHFPGVEGAVAVEEV